MKRSLFFILLALTTTVFGRANVRYAYYGEEFYKHKEARTLTKDFIFAVLNTNHVSSPGQYDLFIANCNGGACTKANSVGYDAARKILFGEIQKEQDNNGTFVRDVYCGKKFYYTNLADVGNMHTKVNIEHTWPQSKFSSRFPKGDQKSDMHHLYLTDSDANNRRGNFWFGDAAGKHDELNVDDCEDSKLVSGGGGYLFEPPVKHRGNVARSMFYFASRYGMTIDAKQEKVLREWHKADPVDEAEVRRHEIVAGYQKVRNPYIDHPETVDNVSDF